MTTACIVTDGSVQFAKTSFPGKDLVHILPFRVDYSGNDLPANPDPMPEFPARLNGNGPLNITAPSYPECVNLLQELSRDYDEILAICLSSHLSSLFYSLEKASRSFTGKTSVSVIDSLTTSVGLGTLVQYAASGLVRHQRLAAVEQTVRGLIPAVYSQLACPNLSYLENAGFLSPAQAILGEGLGILPVFTIEDGKFMALSKVRNWMHILENYLEFIGEFSELDQVAVIQGPVRTLDTAPLREYVSANFPGTLFSDLTANLMHRALFGPAAVSIHAIEKL